MNINGISGATGTAPASALDSVGGASRNSSVPPAAGAAAVATISQPGQLFAQLQQLSQQNPTEFKAVAAQLASTFQTAAQGATGSDAKVLNGLASQFQQAAQTGTLQPTQSQGAQGASGGHHHHHHHGGGQSAGGPSSAVQQAFADAFGIVSQAVDGTSSASSSTTSSST